MNSGFFATGPLAFFAIVSFSHSFAFLEEMYQGNSHCKRPDMNVQYFARSLESRSLFVFSVSFCSKEVLHIKRSSVGSQSSF